MGSRELARKLAFSQDQGMIWTATYDGPWSEGSRQPDVSFIIDLGHNSSGTILMGVDRPDGSVQMRVLDDLTGEMLATIEIESDVDEEAGQIVAIEPGGSMTTFDIETGEIVAHLDEVVEALPLAMRIQPDGLITAVLPGGVSVFDRQTGRVGDRVELRGVAGARIRDDGRVAIITDDLGVSPGDRPEPDGTTFGAPVAIPEAYRMWAVGAGNEIVRFEAARRATRIHRKPGIGNSRRLAEALRNSEFHVMSEAGHYAWEDNPEPSLAHVLRWIDKAEANSWTEPLWQGGELAIRGVQLFTGRADVHVRAEVTGS